MTALLVAVAATRQSSGSAVRSVLLVMLAVVVPVAMLMVRQVRRGRWTNADASNASERPVLFVVSMAGLAAAVVWLLLYDPASFLIRGLVVVAAFIVIAAVLTRWIKLSLHVAFATLTATALSQIGSPVGVALIPLVPVLAWARLVLTRHSLLEVAVGCVLGAATGLALVWR
jgi:membrane-associated phospholipid phosphatase